MKKSTQACLFVTALMLTAAALVVFGKSVLNTGMGIVLEYSYFDALKGTSSFYPETVLWLQVLFVTGILAAGLIWVRKPWTTIVTMILCLSSVIIRMYGNAKHGYGLFTFDEIAGMLMMLLPFLAAGLCIWMLRLPQESAETEEKNESQTVQPESVPAPHNEAPKAAPSADMVDLKQVLDSDDLRFLSTDLSCLADKHRAQNVGAYEIQVVRAVSEMVSGTGVIPEQTLALCVAATQDAIDGVASTFGLSMGGHNALLEKLKKLEEENQ